ncbi:MAG: hypothetical protein IT436_06510 [Phycisphaerales bacterium]|nr:hypothetical protein [Phycisphaerales bacterium]
MKLSIVAASLLAGLSLFTLPACKSSKEVASEVATRDVRSFQASLDQIPGQIDTVMAKLNSLTAGDVSNPSALFADYTRELRTLTEHGAQVAAAKDDAERNVQRYFREWVKQSRGIKTSADRDAAYKAIDAGRSRTDIAMGYLRDGSRDFRALLDKLNGFQSTLAKDLSPASLKSIGSQYGPTLDKAISVKGYIARLSEQIDASLLGK